MNNTFYPANDYRKYLSHGGPGSGRYPKGSGENPYQHDPGKRAAMRSRERGKNYTVIGARNASDQSSDVGSKSSWFDPTFKGGKDKPPMSGAERTVRESEKIIQSTTNIVNSMSKIKGTKRSPAQDLTDEELTAVLKRLRMENEFDRLTADQTADGYSKAVEILSIAGSVVTIAGGLATIASTAYELKKGK